MHRPEDEAREKDGHFDVVERRLLHEKYGTGDGHQANATLCGDLQPRAHPGEVSARARGRWTSTLRRLIDACRRAGVCRSPRITYVAMIMKLLTFEIEISSDRPYYS